MPRTAAATNTATTFQTVLGPVRFNANGDVVPGAVSVYRTDMTAAGGSGDWAFAAVADESITAQTAMISTSPASARLTARTR